MWLWDLLEGGWAEQDFYLRLHGSVELVDGQGIGVDV